MQQLEEVDREVKLWSHIGGGPASGAWTFARSERPETDEKGDRSEPGSMGANEKDRRSDKQP